MNTAALNNRPRGIRKLSELNIQDGRTVIFTEEDAEKLNWSDIPVGSLKVHKETGMISVKLEGESYWVPAGIKNTAEVTRTFFFETWNPTKFYNIGDVVVNPDDHTVYTRIQISDIADKPITSNIFNIKSGEKVDLYVTRPEERICNVLFLDEDPASLSYNTYVNAEALTVISQTPKGFVIYNVSPHDLTVKLIMEDVGIIGYEWIPEDWEVLANNVYEQEGSLVQVDTQYKNDGTISIAKDTRINVDAYKITAINKDDFYYETPSGDRKVGVYNEDGFMVFETSMEYQPLRNSLEVYIDGFLRRTAADGSLTEIDTTRFSINEKLEIGHEILIKYNTILRIGNPYPRIFMSKIKPSQAEIGDIWIDLSEKEIDDEEYIGSADDPIPNIPWEKISGKPTTFRGYGLTADFAAAKHRHDYNVDIYNAPTSLPAKGGNADTVNNYAPNDNKPGTLAIIGIKSGKLPLDIIPKHNHLVGEISDFEITEAMLPKHKHLQDEIIDFHIDKTMLPVHTHSVEEITDFPIHNMIILWYGNISNIPEGWVLCDGNNGAPNLTSTLSVVSGVHYIMKK